MVDVGCLIISFEGVFSLPSICVHVKTWHLFEARLSLSDSKIVVSSQHFGLNIKQAEFIVVISKKGQNTGRPGMKFAKLTLIAVSDLVSRFD